VPLGVFERDVLRLLAQNRDPERFVAGGTVLNQSKSSPRRSKDVDLFHDTAESVQQSVSADLLVLRNNGFELEQLLDQPTFARYVVTKGGQQTKIEWAFDSAFRFFPVEPDPDLGWRLNYWDAATNKVLALAGRREVRDYLDTLWLHMHHLHLGALVWAASGKDLGLTPDFILQAAQRHAHYTAADIEQLDLARPLDWVALKQQWIDALETAETLVRQLPAQERGCFYLVPDTKQPCVPDPEDPTFSTLIRHFGAIKGSVPRLVE
jgi:hypothetical protein